MSKISNHRKRTLTELAKIYEVSRPTFTKYVKAHELKIGDKIGYYYSPNQIKIIVDVLGQPPRIEIIFS